MGFIQGQRGSEVGRTRNMNLTTSANKYPRYNVWRATASFTQRAHLKLTFDQHPGHTAVPCVSNNSDVLSNSSFTVHTEYKGNDTRRNRNKYLPFPPRGSFRRCQA